MCFLQRKKHRKAHGVCCPGRDTAVRRKKDLILLVGSWCLGGLLRGLQNLESSRKGNGFILFACTKRTKSTPEVCEPLDSGERFKSPLDTWLSLK